MTQTVTVPGIGDLEFPDGMSQADMAAAIQKNFPQIHQQPAQPPENPLAYGANGGPTSRVSLTPTQIRAMPKAVQDAMGEQIMQQYARQQMREGLDTVQGAASAATAVPATMAAGLNMSASLLGGRGVEDSLARFAKTQNALTYTPSSQGAQDIAEAVGRGMSPTDVAGQYLGDKSADAGLPPWLSTGLRVGPDAIAALAGIRGSGKAAEVPKPKPEIPTTEQLRAATNEAYNRANQSGAFVSADKFSKAADEIIQNARNDAVDPVLHPKSTRVLQILEERKGKDLTLQEAENIRRIALEAEGDVNNIGQQSADGNRAGKIVDDLDNKIDALSANDEARALNRRKMNSQLLDVMIERAQNNAGSNLTQAGMEHALRLQFKQLANNMQRMKRFSDAQKDAIRKVARGGPVENTLRLFGKAAPTGIVSGGLGVGLGASIGGPVGAAAVPAAGILSRLAARKMTQNNVAAAREALIGRGLPQSQPARPAAVQPLTGELMPRPPLALPAPTIISGPRSAPGSMYARQQMGLTPDVELAGMQHPGMARQTIPQQPKALPYLPAEAPAVSPMVVDPAGRVASSASDLTDYLRDTGQQGMRNVRQPKVGSVFDAIKPEKAQEASAPRARTKGEIQKDIQRLQLLARNLSAEQTADPMYMRALSTEWNRLQSELKRSGSRGGSSPESGARRD